jgi:hypothetical protein
MEGEPGPSKSSQEQDGASGGAEVETVDFFRVVEILTMFTTSSEMANKTEFFARNQGDQIGRVFAHSAIIFFGQFF